MMVPPIFSTLYRNGLKNREFDKEASATCCLEQVTIVQGQGTSENSKWQKEPTPSKTDSSDYFGIAPSSLLHPDLLPDLSAFSSSSTAVATSEKVDDLVQSLIETHATPKKTYPVTADKNGWISLQLTPGVKNLKDTIYRWKRKSDGKILIGMTETTCAKRVSGYISSFNHPEKRKGQLPLPVAVRENPQDFDFGILCQTDKVGLDVLERAYIKKKNSIAHGFNQRNGGGGGRARKKKPTAERVEAARKEILTNFQTPPKKGIKMTKKGYQVLFSPKTKKLKNVLYRFKNTITGKHYVGKTIRPLSKRMSEHCHYAAHKEKDQAKAPLYEAIRENHKAILVSVLYQLPKGQEDLIDEVEKAFIEKYNSYKEGYNQNSGGGGS